MLLIMVARTTRNLLGAMPEETIVSGTWNNHLHSVVDGCRYKNKYEQYLLWIIPVSITSTV